MDNQESSLEKNKCELSLRFQSKAVDLILKKLKELDVFKKNASMLNIENVLLRSLGEYRNINEEIFTNNDGSINEIAVAETMICLKMAILEPDMYYVGNWRESFLSQNFLHNEEWAKEQKSSNYDDEDF